ncbi:MAG: AsmA family protein [Pseudomonadales bacterium]
MFKFLRRLLIAVAVLFVTVTAVAVYGLQDPNRFKPQLESVIAAQSGVPLKINGDLAWRLWPPISLRAEDLSADYQGQDWQVGRLTLDLDAWNTIRHPDRWQVQALTVNDLIMRERGAVLTVDTATLAGITPNRPAPVNARLTYAASADSPALPLDLDGRITVDPEQLTMKLDQTRFETDDGAGVCSLDARPVANPAPTPPATDDDVIPVAVLKSFTWKGECALDWVRFDDKRFERVLVDFANESGAATVAVRAPEFFGGEALGDVAIDANATPVRWTLTPTLSNVDSRALLEWLDQRFAWAAPLAYGGRLTLEGNTADAMLESLSGETRFDGGKGRIDISAIRTELIDLAGRFNEAERIRGWPEQWDYQRFVGTWRIDRQHHVLDMALDNLTLAAEGDYQPASDRLDMLVELTFGKDPAWPVFDVPPLLYDLPIPLRCQGSAAEPECRIDPDAAQRLVARAVSGSDPELRSKLEQTIDEQVPEQYRDAARALLEALGRSQPAAEPQ